MDVMQTQYYRLNVLLLALVGLWPFSRGMIPQMQRIFISTSLLFITINQINSLRKPNQETSDILAAISYVLILTAFLLKYDTYMFYHSTRKSLMGMITTDWCNIQNSEERCILEKYASRGMLYTRVFAQYENWIGPIPIVAVLLYTGAASFCGLPLYIIFLDAIIPLDKPRSRKYPVETNLFFDEDEYYAILRPVIIIYAFIIVTTFIATETISIQCLQHTCALWEITSYRIKKAFQDSVKMDLVSKREASRVLVSGIEMHIQTLNFCKFMERNFAPPYLLLLGLGVSCLSIHLFQFSQLLSGEGKMGEGVSSLLVCIATLAYMFYLNYATQEVIDKSNNVFTESYSGPWYEAPLPMQKLLLMIMMKSFNSYTFDLCGMFNPSIEGFLMIARMSVSYFMMLQSFQ